MSVILVELPRLCHSAFKAKGTKPSALERQCSLVSSNVHLVIPEVACFHLNLSLNVLLGGNRGCLLQLDVLHIRWGLVAFCFSVFFFFFHDLIHQVEEKS